MAVIDSARPASSAPLRARLSNVVSRIVAWNETRQTRKVLSNLSDRELEDIGLSRADIDRMSF